MTQKEITLFEREVRLLTLRLSIPALKEFTEYILFEKCPINDDNAETYRLSVKMAKSMVHYLKARMMYREMSPNKQTDSAIMGTLLHGVYFDGKEEHWRDVFKLREEILKDPEIAKFDTVETHDVIEYTCQVVEAQLGEKMPIVQCRPMAGQITYLVWEIIYFSNYIESNIDVSFEQDKTAFIDTLNTIFNIQLDEDNKIIQHKD